MKKIPLTQGKFALVDDEDYDFLMQWKWRYLNGYAARSLYLGKKDGKHKYTAVYMHRVIMKTPDGIEVDHINYDGLNNQKTNLRNCTQMQNSMNRKSKRGTSSKYKGVFWNNQRAHWAASIRINKKLKWLGRFSSEELAALAYNSAATENFGEFARLNQVWK